MNTSTQTRQQGSTPCQDGGPPSGLRGAARGQAIVLIALLMIVMLGFTGLAVDGGALFFLQRNARNAADAAVLAAAYQLCKDGDPATADSAAIQSAALAAALANDFNNDGVTNTVTVEHPPTSGDLAASLAGVAESVRLEYVQVVIWADSPTYLIQVVYPGPSEVTVSAVARCRKPRPPFSGYALVALYGGVTATGIQTGGGGTIRVEGAGVLSNSQKSSSISVDGGSTLTVDGPVDAVGGISGNGTLTAGEVNTGVLSSPDPLANLIEPANPGGCQNVPNIKSGDVIDLPPGCYNGIQMTGGTLNMSGGLYYFTNEVKITGGDVNATNVMIFMKKGGFSSTSDGNLTLTAQTSGLWAGMLLYSSRDNSSSSQAIKFTAQGTQVIVGTVYAPNVDLEMAGGSDDDVTGQFIASTVKVTGQGDFYVKYDETRVFQMPPELAFVQ